MIITVVDVVLLSSYALLLFLSIFWLLVLFGEKEEEQTQKLSRAPFFSVLVPAYNEEKSIISTLTSLLQLNYPQKKLEIIIINDGSKDGTRPLVEQFIQVHQEITITLINQENKGKGSALNAGLAQAKGEFFACLDADSFVSSNAINEMLPYFEADPQVAAVCPLLKVKDPKSILQKVQWVEYMVNMFYKHLNAKLDCIHVTPGPFSVYRTSIVKDLGGYDEHNLTEDLELAIRLQKHHYKIVQTFDTSVETIAPNAWKKLFRQRIRWYKGSVENSFKYKELMFNRRYGDFGMIRMPTIFLSGLVVIVLMAALLYEMGSKAYSQIAALSAVNFDILTLLKNFTININLLSLPYFKLFIGLTLMSISIFVMFYSYKVIREKITNYGKTWTSLITYMLIYGLFLAIVWTYIAFLFIAKKKSTWH